MLICIDAGNTQIHGGFYSNGRFIHYFRLNTKMGLDSDQFSAFIKSFCQENGIDISSLENIAISSVVPPLDDPLRDAFLTCFKIKPLFVKAGIETGLTINFATPHEVGADLICSAAGAMESYPNRNLVIVDMGTATTITIINKYKEFITCTIIPGIMTQVESLSSSAEKLTSLEIAKPKSSIPKSTLESIQMGIYYSHLGGINLLIKKLSEANFAGEQYTIIGTGGYSRLFDDSGLFNIIDQNLVLKGLVKIASLNPTNSSHLSAINSLTKRDPKIE